MVARQQDLQKDANSLGLPVLPRVLARSMTKKVRRQQIAPGGCTSVCYFLPPGVLRGEVSQL
jgi:hypothetical protein